MTRIQLAVSLLTRALAWTEQEYQEGGARKPLTLASVAAVVSAAKLGRPVTLREIMPFMGQQRREAAVKPLLEYGYIHLHGHGETPNPHTYALTAKGNEFVNTILK